MHFAVTSKFTTTTTTTHQYMASNWANLVWWSSNKYNGRIHNLPALNIQSHCSFGDSRRIYDEWKECVSEERSPVFSVLGKAGVW
jgi:hypothetical protein